MAIPQDCLEIVCCLVTEKRYIVTVVAVPSSVVARIPISGCAERCQPALHTTNVSIGTNEV